MIAKAKAISHGKEALAYALKEHKAGNFYLSNMVESLKPDSILEEFEMVQQYNTRCKNKFLRFEIGIAPQDEAKLTNVDLAKICRRFSKRMGLEDHQWIACTHKDTDNLHIHLIANRIGIDGSVYQTDFISNKASRAAEEISRELNLTIANDAHKNRKEEQDKKQEKLAVNKNGHHDPDRLLIKDKLQEIAYMELRSKKYKTPASLLKALYDKYNIRPEYVKNKQGKVYGLRFYYEGCTFKASEIGKEFGLHSLYNQFGLRITGQSSFPKHFDLSRIITANDRVTNDTTNQARDSANSNSANYHSNNTNKVKEDDSISSVASALSSIPNTDYDATAAEQAEQYLWQKNKKKKKKKNRGMRW